MAEELEVKERPEGGEERLMDLTPVVRMETKERVLSPSLAVSAGVGEDGGAAAASGGAKRKRVTEGDFEVACLQLRSRRISQGVGKWENMRAQWFRTSSEKGSNDEDWDRVCRFAGEVPRMEEAAATATEVAEGSESNYDRELGREETTIKELRRKEAEDMASTATPADAGGRCKMEAPPPATSTVTSLAASEREIEEFFAPAERKERERFSKKYNYDVVRDSPLEGRYEWIRIEP